MTTLRHTLSPLPLLSLWSLLSVGTAHGTTTYHLDSTGGRDENDGTIKLNKVTYTTPGFLFYD